MRPASYRLPESLTTGDTLIQLNPKLGQEEIIGSIWHSDISSFNFPFFFDFFPSLLLQAGESHRKPPVFLTLC